MSSEWQMLFNVKKCRTMHIGKQLTEREYRMNVRQLDTVKEEKDLGVLIRNDMKSSSQCSQAFQGKQNAWNNNRPIEYKNKEIMLSLYKSLVHPLIEYCTV